MDEDEVKLPPAAPVDDDLDLFGDAVELEPPAPLPPAPDLNGLADDLFGDGDGAVNDDAASVATDPLVDDGQPQLTAEEVAARQALEYREEDMHYVEVQEKVAAVSLLKLPTPHSSDGQYWHIKLPSYLRIDENEFDEMMYEEPEGDAEDFPEENVIRWRWAEVNGQRVRESNARIVQWSDGSQALQVGAEFFNVNITSSRAVDDDAPKNDAVNGHASSSSSLLPIAGLTLLVAQHSGAYLLEAQAAITGTMSLTPYNVTSTAHRRLATTLSDRHAKVTRTQAVVLERDPEIERAQRDKADADRAKQARRERAKASGGGGAARRRRGLGRSMRIDRSDDEDEEAMDEGDSDEPRGATGTRTSGRPGTGAGGRRPAYLDGPDEDDNGFVVESEDDGAGEAAEEEGAPDDDLDDLEARAEQAARKAKGARRPAQSSDRDAEGEMDIDPPAAEPEASFVKKRLVIGDDDDDDDE